MTNEEKPRKNEKGRQEWEEDFTRKSTFLMRVSKERGSIN